MGRNYEEPDLFSEEEPASQEVEKLDVDELGTLLRERRGKLSLRQAATAAGVSFSTFSRVEGGAQPDLATFTRLCAWLSVPPSRFFTPVVEREISPIEQAISHLRTDPRLSDEAAEKIGSVMRDLYDALAQDVEPSRPAVACHLRATNVMRPGVAQRLAPLLGDMQDELRRLVEAGEL
ncbi:helix-turn-helix transcriptional regulator [Streptomyces sp. NPDC005827]|uniref:helix-turn-helix domain-containing protein n=1 Tax=Streptomyces sp. NPDC005827 TaxID=3157070 RepID=UPI003411E33B